MPSPIPPIRNPAAPEPIRLPPGNSSSGDFRNVFEGAVQRVEHSRDNAAQAVERFLSGEEQELHSTALAVQEAELAFDLFLQMRNKVVQAYQEIMRMQV
jgi:flagellar hook-basal body complex protein FliE